MKYSELNLNSLGLLRKNGVHILDLRNVILIYRLQIKLQEICYFYSILVGVLGQSLLLGVGHSTNVD